MKFYTILNTLIMARKYDTLMYIFCSPIGNTVSNSSSNITRVLSWMPKRIFKLLCVTPMFLSRKQICETYRTPPYCTEKYLMNLFRIFLFVLTLRIILYYLINSYTVIILKLYTNLKCRFFNRKKNNPKE